MFRSLYARLSLALIGLFLVTGVVYTLITNATTERHLQEITQHFNRDLAQRIVADRQLVINGAMDDKALKNPPRSTRAARRKRTARGPAWDCMESSRSR